ncbi:hypothetical protein E1B28_010607 [Marasmius oreades]|uniref:Isomerase YbhE n=1 Tax=Marasmius oreades TaxID=181124 RepID=A0A9P7RXI4_9AGAR|nr:uncharacterized protein E1B28_010607 [Marasmius oreades]KAG7091586.1 hypothetical protein E1B28_010607 [Marasmius oreades]
MSYRILGSSYTEEVYTLEFVPSKATITVSSSLRIGYHPSWITAHPTDPSLVFACLEQAEGTVVALKYDESGNGKVVAEASSGGKDPCHLLVKDGELLIANYSSGDLSILSVTHEAPYILSKSPTTIYLPGTGPNRERQESPHPHGVFWIDETNELMVPNLGADVIHRLTRRPDGTWTIVGEISYPPGGGPRHVAAHDGILYTLLELSSRLVKGKLLQFPKQPVILASESTLSHPPQSPNDMLAAEILIPKPNSTYPEAYVYVSNRNDPSAEGDTIAIFEASDSDSLNMVGEVRTGLRHLRGMAFGGPENRWLITGGGNGGGVKVFERINGGKDLRLVAKNEDVKAPTGFLWM